MNQILYCVTKKQIPKRIQLVTLESVEDPKSTKANISEARFWSFVFTSSSCATMDKTILYAGSRVYTWQKEGEIHIEHDR